MCRYVFHKKHILLPGRGLLPQLDLASLPDDDVAVLTSSCSSMWSPSGFLVASCWYPGERGGRNLMKACKRWRDFPGLFAAVGFAALAFLAPTALGGSEPSIASSKIADTASDPLRGTWDTGRIPASKLRVALRSAGYSNANVTKLFHEFGIVKAQRVPARLLPRRWRPISTRARLGALQAVPAE